MSTTWILVLMYIGGSSATSVNSSYSIPAWKTLADCTKAGEAISSYHNKNKNAWNPALGYICIEQTKP